MLTGQRATGCQGVPAVDPTLTEGPATEPEPLSLASDPVPGSADLLAANPLPAILVFDTNGLLVWADHGAARMSGLAVDALLGHGWRVAIHPEDLDQLLACWDMGTASGAPFGLDVRVLVDGGAGHWVHVEVVPIPAVTGVGGARVAVVTDVVAERGVVARARSLDRLTDAVFRNAPIGIEVFGWDGTASAVNPTHLRIIGVPDGAPHVGRFNPLTDPIAAASREDFLRAFGGETVTSEFTAPPGDAGPEHRVGGRRSPTVRQVLVPIRDDEGAVESVVAYAWDVTEEREAATRQLALERELAEARHLESLATLAGGIAHDFNNLHAAILGHAALARREVAPDSVAAGDLEQIQTAARRAGDLSRELLTYSGRVQVTLEPVDFALLVRRAVETITDRLGDHELLLDLSPETPWLRGDAGPLRQVVRSLVVNALEAFPEGSAGRISVRTGPAGDGPGARDAFIEVADTGIGMSEDTRERMVDPFFSTKAVGRGLGMAAVDGIVRAHGGSLAIASAPGVGTTVRIVLPGVEAAVPAPAVSPSSAPGATAVLVVEDETVLARLSTRILERAGYAVAVAADGAEALDRLGDPTTPIDVVLLDMTLPPGVAGADVYQAVERLRPGVPVVVSTGWSAEDVDARIKGYAGFLQKPYHPDALLAAIGQAVAGRRP